jgi:hypothetical protein
MKMIVEKQMECRLARETEVLGENLPQRHLTKEVTGRFSTIYYIKPSFQNILRFVSCIFSEMENLVCHKGLQLF